MVLLKNQSIISRGRRLNGSLQNALSKADGELQKSKAFFFEVLTY